MKPTAAARTITRAIQANTPIMLWGAPGVGKSAIVADVAKTTTRTLYDVRVTLLDPVDLRGIPFIKDGVTFWGEPCFLPRDNSPAILFLDELSAAPAMVQAALYQLILDRKLGEYTLPDNTAIVAAGNRQSDRAVSTRMSSALSSRFLHSDIDVDTDDWSTWAIGAGIAPEVIAFIRFRPELLNDFDPQKNTGHTFACPRTWEMASRIMATGPMGADEYDTLAGTIGEGAATEFCAFLRIFRDLPNPDAVLLTPDTAAIPSAPATLYALSGALARKASATNADRLFTYANRLPSEFSVLLATMAIKYCPLIQSSAGFTTWATKHADILS